MSGKPDTNTEKAGQAADSPAKLTGRQRAKPAAEGQGVRLDDKAAGQIKSIIEKENYPDTMYVYVGVKGGGCSGLQYVLDLRDEAHVPVNETDEVFESHGIMIVCDLKSFIVGNLNGTVVEYKDDSLMGAGFTFNNPNAKQSCGCGASYTA